ncbi:MULTISPECIES: hypothetical protein [unclassified Lentimonas]|uniref:hypothetical protein n=1 Tax=unclassified Lentimonas TaxID=2630993 RepID=UPI001389F719|nr:MULTISPECIES: hypothetical protein [unclassified Lentimonas]
MKLILQILNLVCCVFLPFVFVGSAFFVIPEFLTIYQDMYKSGLVLPKLTQLVMGAPRFIWLVIAGAFAALNLFSVLRLKCDWLLLLSVAVMFLLSGTIVVASFLPVSGGIIKQLPPSDSVPVGK